MFDFNAVTMFPVAAVVYVSVGYALGLGTVWLMKKWEDRKRDE